MKSLNEIITAMEACTVPGGMECERCAYNGVHDCQTAMDLDALEVLKKHRALRALIQDKRRGKHREEATIIKMIAYEIDENGKFLLDKNGRAKQVEIPPKRADMVCVIRCKDCVHFMPQVRSCRHLYASANPEGFCSDGERRKE